MLSELKYCSFPTRWLVVLKLRIFCSWCRHFGLAASLSLFLSFSSLNDNQWSPTFILGSAVPLSIPWQSAPASNWPSRQHLWIRREKIGERRIEKTSSLHFILWFSNWTLFIHQYNLEECCSHSPALLLPHWSVMKCKTGSLWTPELEILLGLFQFQAMRPAYDFSILKEKLYYQYDMIHVDVWLDNVEIGPVNVLGWPPGDTTEVSGKLNSIDKFVIIKIQIKWFNLG